MARYEVTGHIYEDTQLLKAVRFELEAESSNIAIGVALERFKTEYPGKVVTATAKEVADES